MKIELCNEVLSVIFRPMKHLVMGTAGHVDHGKTSLVKGLTGVDTDRLKEEKERGITIELGFASLTLPDGRTLGLVDVPGHERFVKNMVSGAAGIDLVVLVIGADEGVMPQTREHLHICSLLGIREGLVALTKIDLVEPDWLSLVTDDVRQFLQGTFLENSPIVTVSSATMAGFDELLQVLQKTASNVEEGADAGIFRLPVDRIFTMKGFGTVVTGTLLSGRIDTGDEVEVYPRDIVTKIRGIQVHNQSVPYAESGQRTALNLQGVDKALVLRGDVLARPGTVFPTQRLDLFCDYLAGAGRKLKNRSLVRFHVGTSEVMARILLLEGDEWEPGQSGYAQLILASPIVAVAGDRYVIRSYSPVTTIGGGVILDPLPAKHKRYSPPVLAQLQSIHRGSENDRTMAIVERAGLKGITTTELVARTGYSTGRLRKIMESILSKREALLIDREEERLLWISAYENLQERILERLRSFHERFPLKEGTPREELRTMLGFGIGPKLYHTALRDLEKAGQVVIDRENVRLSEHRVHLAGGLDRMRSEILKAYRESGLTVPSFKDVMEPFAGRRSEALSLVQTMLKDGMLVKVTEDLYFHRDVLAKLREDYRAYLLREGKATPASMKELTGLSRKYIIPLMEYFDAAKLTIRTGDQRILRE